LQDLTIGVCAALYKEAASRYENRQRGIKEQFQKEPHG
jgi:hypothetical protein